MNENYPYPEAEHYIFPTNNLEMMQHDMRKFSSAKDMRSELTQNLVYYRETPLCKAMHSYASLSKLALVNHLPEGSQVDSAYMTDFYAGSASSLHGLLHPGPHKKKEWILSQNPLGPVNAPDTPDSIRGPLVEELIELMDAWRIGDAAIAFDEQTDEFKEILMEYATRLYDDLTESTAHTKNFIDGYMFTLNFILRYGAQYDKFLAKPNA